MANKTKRALAEDEIKNVGSSTATLEYYEMKTSSQEQVSESKATATFFSCSVNLLKTLIGAGMLSLPFAFSLVGIIPGLLLFIIAASMSIFGYFLLVKSSYEVCGRKGGFGPLASASYPNLEPVFDFAVAFKCLGVAIGYLKIVADLIPEIIQGFRSTPLPESTLPWYMNRIVWVTVTLLVILPTAFMKRMDSLKYTSFLGLISVIYLVVLSVVLWIGTIGSTGSWIGDGSLFVKLTPSCFRAFPMMVFAFGGQQNIFAIHNEAADNTPTWMLRVIYTCVGIAFTTYSIFATGSVATWNSQSIQANIINNYPSDGAQFIIARMLYVFLLTFTMPIIYYPARESILNIFQFASPAFLQSHYKKIFSATVVLMLIFTWAITCINPPLDFVLGVIGSSAAPLICFFLPAFFWLKIDPDRSRWNPLRTGCYALLIFALVSTALSITALVINFLQ